MDLKLALVLEAGSLVFSPRMFSLQQPSSCPPVVYAHWMGAGSSHSWPAPPGGIEEVAHNDLLLVHSLLSSHPISPSCDWKLQQQIRSLLWSEVFYDLGIWAQFCVLRACGRVTWAQLLVQGTLTSCTSPPVGLKSCCLAVVTAMMGEEVGEMLLEVVGCVSPLL